MLIGSLLSVVEQQPATHGCSVFTILACLCGAPRAVGSPEHENRQYKAEQEGDLEDVGEQEHGLFIHGVRTYGVPMAAVSKDA